MIVIETTYLVVVLVSIFVSFSVVVVIIMLVGDYHTLKRADALAIAAARFIMEFEEQSSRLTVRDGTSAL